MKVSVLVAFRDDSPAQFRQRLWDWVRARLAAEHPEFEIVVGTDDGTDPFHKTLALNRAAAQATGDVLYVLDSDSWVPPAQVNAALIGIEADPAHWWRPWEQKVKLNEGCTAEVLAGNWDGNLPKTWIRAAENRNSYWAAPPLLLHRELFDAVHGFDERFRGWGQEDDAFAWSLRALFGSAATVEGRCIHLWHPRLGRSGRDRWPGQDVSGSNVPLAQTYRHAGRSPEAMRDLIANRSTRERLEA